MAMHAVARLKREESGSMLVEFGLLFIPLVVVIVGIIEIGLVLLAQQVLQSNTSNAVRVIERGEALGLSAEDARSLARQAICSGTLVLVGEAACNASLKLDVRIIDGSPVPSMFDDEGAIDDDAFAAGNGVAGNAMLVRAVLALPSLTGFLPDLITGHGGQRIVAAQAVFRIDPYASAL
ncbi:TadE/TadG family type IV pilus assembly protein [Ancylobacter vacuolatus]|jgi:Flp pilus assembly pilin Flp